MLKQNYIVRMAFLCLPLAASAQAPAPLATADTVQVAQKPKTTISGFADAYYRYDFAGTSANNRTSFTNSHNSFELGMISVRADHSFGRGGVTADIGFGKRAEDFSYADDRTRFVIKQLYFNYEFRGGYKATVGSWATHVGYEMVDAPLNRNYSMSYLFSYGPFFHTGLKVEKTFGRVGAMLGVANPTDLKSTPFGQKFVIGQLSTVSKNEKFKTFLNFQGGKPSDSTQIRQIDLVVNYLPIEKWSFGFNATVFDALARDAESNFESAGKWWGAAVYLNSDPRPWLGLTLRSEYFSDADGLNVFAGTTGGNILANTFSLNFKKDNITVIPEIRFEVASEEIFIGKNDAAAKSSVAAAIAVIYKI